MTSKSRCLGVVVAAYLAALAYLGGGSPSTGAGKKTSEEQIARWIKQLGSEEFKARDEATRRLKELDESLPALIRALKVSDPETRRRLETIIPVLEARLAVRLSDE